jgi:hypothetical protein
MFRVLAAFSLMVLHVSGSGLDGGGPIPAGAVDRPAAVATAISPSSSISCLYCLVLLNRENDPWIEAEGTNMYVGNSPEVTVPGGILLASGGDNAGVIQGGGEVTAPFTYIRDKGEVQLKGSGVWRAPPVNMDDGPQFYDPFGGISQPPLRTDLHAYLPLVEVPDGDLAAACGGVCSPGIYYTTRDLDRDGIPETATGERMFIQSDVSFVGGGTFDTREYIFFGGLEVRRAHVSLVAGKYVLAGVADTRTAVFENRHDSVITSYAAGVGLLLIFTNSSYGGQLTVASNRIVKKTWTSLQFGQTILRGGDNNSGVRLEGLNGSSWEVQSAGLADYAGVLGWQDRMNSVVKYDSSTNDVDSSCGDINKPCLTGLPADENRELEIWVTSSLTLYGFFVQPRGAWADVRLLESYSGLQILTGALRIQGHGSLVLLGAVSTL